MGMRMSIRSLKQVVRQPNLIIEIISLPPTRRRPREFGRQFASFGLANRHGDGEAKNGYIGKETEGNFGGSPVSGFRE
jgi:hypothetical protein